MTGVKGFIERDEMDRPRADLTGDLFGQAVESRCRFRRHDDRTAFHTAETRADQDRDHYQKAADKKTEEGRKVKNEDVDAGEEYGQSHGVDGRGDRHRRGAGSALTGLAQWLLPQFVEESLTFSLRRFLPARLAC